MLGFDHGIRVIFRLILDQQADTVPNSDQPFDATFSGDGGVDRRHAAVFPVIHLPVHQRKAEIADAGVGGNGEVFFLISQLFRLILGDTAVDALDGLGQQLAEILILIGDTGCLRAKGTADLLHLAEDHFRMIDEVLVHFEPVGVGIQMHPTWLIQSEGIPLLEKEDVRGDVGAGSGFEGVVGEPDRPQQIGPLSDIFPHYRAFLVHRALGGHKSDYAAWSHLIQGFGKEVVVDQEVVLVVTLVRQLEIAKGDVADGHIKKAVRQLRSLEALDSDGGCLIELLRDAPGDSVQLHAEDAGACHALRLHAHKVADAAGGLQQVSVLKAQILQGLIHGADHNRRRIEGGQCRFSCRGKFLVGQHRPQLRIMQVVLVEIVRQTAPAHILREYALLDAVGQPMLALQLLQKLNGADVVIKAIQRRTDADIFLLNTKVEAALCGDLRVEHGRRQLGAELRRRWGEYGFFFSRFLPRWQIDRLRVSLLKCEHVLAGLLGELRGQHGLPQHFVHTAFRRLLFRLR